MKKSFKGIIASVVAMMVFIPVVKADTEIKEVNVTIASPTVGGTVTVTHETCSYTSPAYTDPDTGETYPEEEISYPCSNISAYPVVTLGSSNYAIGDSGNAYWITGLPSQGEGFDEPFSGTFEEGKSYVAEVYLVPASGYYFASDVALTVNGETTGFELSDWNFEGQLMFYAPIVATSASSEETTTPTETTTKTETATTTEATTTTEKAKVEVLNGKEQKYDATASDRLTFRFDLAYSEFLASGKVFVDGKEVDKANYETKEGSTIVIFTKAFTNKLKAGNHEMKIATDNKEATTSFTVTKAVKNPQTGDNILTYVALAIVSAITLAYVSKKKIFD